MGNSGKDYMEDEVKLHSSFEEWRHKLSNIAELQREE